MGAWGNFTAVEEAGTATVQFTNEGITASVTLRVPEAGHEQVAADLMLNRRVWPKPVPGGIVPQCDGVTAAPADVQQYVVDGGLEVITYPEMFLTVSYTTIELAQPTVDSIEPTAEFITLDSRCFRWGGPNGGLVMPEEAPGLLLRGFNFVRTFSDRTTPPHTDYVTKVGHVNNAPVFSSTLNFTFGTETLLYQPPNISWSPRLDGSVRFNVVLKGTFKPETWNKYYRSLVGAWQFMHLAGDINPFRSYPLADMTNIWDYG